MMQICKLLSRYARRRCGNKEHIVIRYLIQKFNIIKYEKYE